jgi:hypothetical protein
MALVVLEVGLTAGVAQAAPPAGGDRYALVIGIDHFQGNTRPNTGAVGDANLVKSALLQAGWSSDHIRVLTDSAATKSAILDGLGWLAGHSSPTSFSVFAYSGHVKQSGSTEYLWPTDNQFIPDTELATGLRAVKGYLWADISGCESAGFNEGLAGPKTLFTAASQENEKGYELSPELHSSVFTNLLVDKGLIQKQGDTNHDGRVSIQEAFAWAASHAPTLTANESNGPQHPYLAGGDGTEWFLDGGPTPAAAVAPPAPPPPAKHCILFICL